MAVNYNLTIFTVYELFVSLSTSFLVVFCTLFVYQKRFKKNGGGQIFPENISESLFAGVLVICNLSIVQSCIRPSVDLLRLMIGYGGEVKFSDFLLGFGYTLIFFVISLFFGTLFLFLSIKLYDKSTPGIEEMEEIKKNNLSIAILLSSVILGITLYMRPPLERFIDSLIQYDRIQSIRGVGEPK